MKFSPLLVALCCATFAFAQVDNRASQSPVKNQGGRGTCVAFAICAALETFPGVPTDISEQLLYATVKLHENAVDKWLRKSGAKPSISEGNKFENYVRLFDLVGTCHESFLPYDPNPRQAGAKVPAEIRRYLELAQVGEHDLRKLRDGFGKYGFRAADCTVLMPEQAHDVARIKRELDNGRLAIPVSYAIYGPKWSTADDDPKRDRTYIHPGLMWQYRFAGEKNWLDYGACKLLCGGRGLDFVEAVRTDKVQRKKFPDPENKFYGGHALTIVGYDDRGFLVKNSWGSWGDAGYCTVSYDYHALLATRALLLDDVYIRTPRLSPFEVGAAIKNAKFWLKVQPVRKNGKSQLVFSTWAQEPRDPNVEVVEYAIEGQDQDGKWTSRLRRVVRCGDTEARRGAPLVVAGAQQLLLMGCKRLRATVRYGAAQVIDPNNPNAATFLRSVSFVEFNPWLQGAVDLPPR
tara:strand:- start:45668 stop:47050 length:1383 start_codon:yes stop_codon:yes gene_type:complete